MARIEFMDFNGEPMSRVKDVITRGAILQPLNFELSESSAYSSDFPWEDPNATISLIEATTNENFALIGWDVEESSATYLQSFSVDMDTLASKILDTNDMKNLVVDNLTVTGNTNLGDNSAEDTVTISATVIGLNCNADFTGGTISATSAYFTELYIGNQPYQPFFTASAFTEGFDPYRLWIDTTNADVPIIKYCINAANASISTNWVALGAVFG